MDAVKFILEKNRMCNWDEECRGCPFENRSCDPFSYGYLTEAEEYVKAVEKWSEEHPIAKHKTNSEKFREVFGCDLVSHWNMGLNIGITDILGLERKFNCSTVAEWLKKEYVPPAIKKVTCEEEVLYQE